MRHIILMTFTHPVTLSYYLSTFYRHVADDYRHLWLWPIGAFAAVILVILATDWNTAATSGLIYGAYGAVLVANEIISTELLLRKNKLTNKIQQSNIFGTAGTDASSFSDSQGMTSWM